MTSKFKLETPIEFSKRQKRWMLKGFWIALILVVVKIMTADAPSPSKAGALLIAVMSLLPAYLWCADRAKGLPLFPIMALTYLASHAFPLVSKNPNVLKYSESLHFNAAVVVAIFLVVGTITWLRLVQHEPQGKSVIKVFKPKQITPFFLQIIFCSILFDLLQNTGYIWQIIPGQIYTTLKTALPALTSLGLMILGYQLGAKCLSRQQAIIFLGLITCLVFQAGVSLYLNIGGVYTVLTSLGWMLGSGKLPWRLLLVTFLIISFLNLGKSETRAIYWNKGAIQPGQYTTVYVTWINNSLKQINIHENSLNKPKQKSESINDRASLIHILMKAISDTGTIREYLNGKTYAIIPQLLVPRILNPNKLRGAEATNMLNIHYGRQTYEQTLTTQISWGMLQEAYANFGTIGCAGLGVFLGSLYGYVTRLAMKVPITSYRFLISLALIMLSAKNEVTLSSFLSILSQVLMLLFAIRIVLMKNTTCYHYPNTYRISY
ncbi:hypothetical protein [Nostoc sp. FACHB-190]|uniref:hypothetical protein n=1 Tax=Nostoc sp. FACHB-190 TaxID=2692838 RepID=UPI0016887D94|nr:hypothetical protein [Nostoc sp. FACHB-190]MBD2297289.1 hypothetical protein [Nostoc sp. FACHB-190]